MASTVDSKVFNIKNHQNRVQLPDDLSKSAYFPTLNFSLCC